MPATRSIKSDFKMDVDLTPMIDVCFLLITFFIMVVEVAKAECVEIFLPFASYAKPDENAPDNRLVINIDRKGEVFMRSEGFGRPNNEGNRKRITDKLKGYAAHIGFEDSQQNSPCKMTVLLRVDAHAEYRFVQCVMVMLADPQIRIKKIHYGAKNPNPV